MKRNILSCINCCLFVLIAIPPAQGSAPTPRFASLLTPVVVLEIAVHSKFYWLPVPSDAILAYDAPRDIQVTVTGDQRVRQYKNLVPLQSAIRRAGARSVLLAGSERPHFIQIRRLGIAKRPVRIAIRVAFIGTSSTLQESFIKTRIGSPFLSYPGAEALETVPFFPNTESMRRFVLETYGYSMTTGTSLFNYLRYTELPLSFCSGLVPSGKASGEIYEPDGATHKKARCGIIAFIQSMLRMFPGALAPDALTNPTEWDRIAESISHSSIGITGSTMVEYINKNYADKEGTADHKRYCAAELNDHSSVNLAAYAEDCDIKLLVYDPINMGVEPFGHYVEITSVDPTSKRIGIRDNNDSYTVPYDESTPSIDLTRAPTTTPLGKHFSGADHIAGDGIFEKLVFVAVCPCDTSHGQGKMPKTTRSGKTLNP